MSVFSTKFSLAPVRLAVIAFALVAATLGNARADEQLPKPESPAAQSHFDAGNAAFRGAQAMTDPTVQSTGYQEAIKEYLAGLETETKFHYTFYWNLGHSYRQLGEYTRATYFYKKFLEFAPARFTLHRTAAEDFIRMMRAELDKSATLSEPAGPAPTPMHDPVTQTTDKTTVRSPSRGRRVLGWSLIGGGVIVGAAAGFAAWSAVDKDHQADVTRLSSARAALYDAADTRATIAAIGAGVAGAAIIGGVVVLITGHASTEHRPAPIALTITSHQASISASLSF